ncbi:hypothetical protein CMI37_37140 [Candidatus Pacearchaeota archaeon]|nr:hypothetical protein [Candidatus Pacearchaeota archaeon]
MPFHTDKQRKAVMAKLNQGSVRSNVNPEIVKVKKPNGQRRLSKKRFLLNKLKRNRIEFDNLIKKRDKAIGLSKQSKIDKLIEKNIKESKELNFQIMLRFN